MHMHCEIWTKNIPDNLETFVARMMGRKSFWDWYQIGGRWTGDHDNYVPKLDPRNQNTCDMCGGSGSRSGGEELFGKDWAEGCRGCNSCHGTGVKTKWPTDFMPYEGDVMEVSKVRDDLDCYTLIIHRGRCKETHHSEVWNGKTFVKGTFSGTVKEFLKSKGIEGGYLITVDYHS